MSFIKIKDPRRREELIKDLIETRKRIKDNFIAKKVGESEYQTGLTKLFKPVMETQKATAKEITDTQKEVVQKITGELLPIREGLQNLTILPPIEAGEEAIPALEMTEEEKENFGKVASEYLGKYLEKNPNTDTLSSGIFRVGKKIFRIDSEMVKIENDDIIINDENFKGTPGLWRLITSKNIPEKGKYKAKDLMDYINIMSITNTTRVKHNKNGKRISGNDKMNNLIKPLVIALEEGGEDNLIYEIEKHFKEETDEEETDEEETDEDDDLQPSTSGTGLKILPSNPNALIDRFDLLFSSKKAGHTGVRNEIVSILDELKRQRVINTKEYKKLNSLIKK